MAELSPTMKAALREIHERGRIYRFDGGFWAHKDWPGCDFRKPKDHFGTRTIDALYDRGLIGMCRYPEHPDSAYWPRFNVAFSLRKESPNDQ